MFVRFVLQRRNEDSGVRDGFFSAAYALCEDGATPGYAAAALGEHIAWFRNNLDTPYRFSRSTAKGADRRASKGVSWFKPDALECIARAFDVKAILDEYGYPVDVLKTDRPGYVVYEDALQIVAEPFADTP